MTVKWPNLYIMRILRARALMQVSRKPLTILNFSVAATLQRYCGGDRDGVSLNLKRKAI